MIDIIIPSWNQADLTVKCLQSIRQFSKDYRIIFVDNGSDPDQFSLVYTELKNNPHTLIKNSRNLGFIKAVNEGLKYAAAPYVVLMNNDTEAVKNWLEMMKAPFENPEVAAVGGRTTTKDSWQGAWTGTENTILLPTTAMLAFFCTMFRLSAIRKVGYLNEEFGVGLGDDDEYCLRLHRAGYRLALVEPLVITHHHRSTFKQLYSETQIKEMQSEALKKFHSIKEKI